MFVPGRDQFICSACEEPMDEDEAPVYCPHCGWDGFGFAVLSENEEAE